MLADFFSKIIEKSKKKDQKDKYQCKSIFVINF